MKLHIHISSSAILGGTMWSLTHSVSMAVSAFVSGILIDIDHLFDFLVFSGEKFSIKGFFSWFHYTRWERITILLHSYELYLVLGIIAFFYSNDILIGFLLGGGLHLILDQIGTRHYGPRSPMFYFLAYRYSVGFNKNKMFIGKHDREIH